MERSEPVWPPGLEASEEELLELGAVPAPAPWQKARKWSLRFLVAAAVAILAVSRYAAHRRLFVTSSTASEVSLREKHEEQEESEGLVNPAKCSGSIPAPGFGSDGQIHVINAKYNVPGADAIATSVFGSSARTPLSSRAYFGSGCGEKYDPKEYLALNVLGKQLQFTVDLSGAGCGCNAAFYFTSMHYMRVESACGDYYCDAMSVCGVTCPEIDLMEANKFAFRSTLHSGLSNQQLPTAGFGGGGADWTGPRDWSEEQYGPGAHCIDTNRPFQVAARFPVDDGGRLQAVKVVLLQLAAEKNCELMLEMSQYTDPDSGEDMMDLLSKTLKQGMTPIISYWESGTMTWLDGHGPNEHRLCDQKRDAANRCGDVAVDFSSFFLSDLV